MTKREVIDADGHVIEPWDLWAGAYMPAAHRPDGPVMGREDGILRYQDGRAYEFARTLRDSGTLGYERPAGEQPRYGDGRRGATDPYGRLEDLDLDGIDAVALYPTMGLAMAFVEDPTLAGAMCRAYNLWLADWVSVAPERLIAVGMVPVQSVAKAIEELRFARSTLGFKAVVLRPHRYKGRTIHSPVWDPFWAVAQELDCAIAFHGSGAWPEPQTGADHFSDGYEWAAHVVIHPFEQQLAMVGLMQTGVFDRFPQLRVAFLESGGGWIVPMLDRLERHYDQRGDADAKTQQRPREYFEKNCWISFEPAEPTLGRVVDWIGPSKVLWATDYPHRDGFFPGAPTMVERCLAGCSAATKDDVLGGGARAFYGL